MKGLARVLGMAVMIFAPLGLSAQSGAGKALSFGVSGGLAVPTGETADNMKTGYDVTGHVFYNLSSSGKLALRGDVSYDKWSAKDEFGDFNSRILGIVGNVILSPSTGAVRPYLLGGAGVFRSKSSSTVAGATGSYSSDSEMGVQVGAGLQFQLSGFSTFAEARYVNVFADGGDAKWIPIVFGVRF